MHDDRVEILGASLSELRARRTSVKWRYYPPDVLPVWVAEMDARPCAPVVDAVTDALRRGDTGYPSGGPLVEAFAGFAWRRWGWPVDPGAAALVPDVMTGIAELLRVATGPDAPVVISPPCYDAFYKFLCYLGRPVVEAPLDAGHRLDPAALEAAFERAGAGAAYVLCNPQNPTGTVHTADELATLARLAREHDVLVLSDEIHAPLVQPDVTFTPYLAAAGTECGIALVSGSKAWNLAGLPAALAVPGTETVGALRLLHEVVADGASHLGVIAHTAAYEQGEPWLDQLLAEIAERRALLTGLLAEQVPTIRPVPAEATYLAWLDCSGLGLPDPTAAFLDHGRVALAAGTQYDRGATQWARFNLGTSREVIEEAVRRMAVACAVLS